MKKRITIFFLSIYLFSTTEICQLFKLPIVFQHYAEHKLMEKNISFLGFLSEHYLHSSPKDPDYARDMQLPFKTSHDCVFSIAAGFVPKMVQFSIAEPVKISKKKSYVYHTQFLIPSYLSNIWQPPKAC